MIWQRNDAESSEAFAAFVVYRDLGRERTLDLTAERLGKSRSLISRWSADHEWVARATAYDTHLAAIADTERLKAYTASAAASAEEWAQRLAGLREREWGISQKLLQRVEQMLEKPIDETDWKMADLAKLFELSVRMTRYLELEATTHAPDDDEPPTIQVEYVNP